MINKFLYKKIHYAIATSIYKGEQGFNGYSDASKKIEKITIQSQIEILNELKSLDLDQIKVFLNNKINTLESEI